MSVDRSFYAGPHLVCTVRPSTRKVTESRCANKKCHNSGTWQSTPFCPACGTVVRPTEVTIKDEPELYELVGDALHDMRTTMCGDAGDTLCLGPNEHRKGAPRHGEGRKKDSESFNESLLGVDMKAEMAWFEKAFAPEIAKIREAYDDVRISWGIHQWFT